MARLPAAKGVVLVVTLVLLAVTTSLFYVIYTGQPGRYQDGRREVVRVMDLHQMHHDIDLENGNNVDILSDDSLASMQGDSSAAAQLLGMAMRRRRKGVAMRKTERREKSRINTATLPLFPCNVTHYGTVRHITKEPPLEHSMKLMSESHGGRVRRGGKWAPTSCKARTKVALVVPLRNRKVQLKIFLAYMHPFMQQQNLDYQIFVVEQGGTSPFNRGALSNIGFKEAMNAADFDCIVISDVDLIPEDFRNPYSCDVSPKHLSVAIDKFDYRLPYATIFGGVGSFKPADFLRINGYSNLYWGWCCEDDDLYQRVTAERMELNRPSMALGRYSMIFLNHERSDKPNTKSLSILKRAKQRYKEEGLSTLKYTVLRRDDAMLATKVLIDIQPSDHVYYTTPLQ